MMVDRTTFVLTNEYHVDLIEKSGCANKDDIISLDIDCRLQIKPSSNVSM